MNRAKVLSAAVASLVLLSFLNNLHAQQPTPRPSPAEPQTGSITGRVTGERGQPLPGAAVTIQPVNSILQRRIATADNNGTFRITDLDEKLYTISASLPAYTTVPHDKEDPAPYYRIGDHVNLEMIRGGVITGAVTNSSGEPVVAVRVRAWLIRDVKGQSSTESFSITGETTTDDRGIYRIYGLVPGTYVVSAGNTGLNSYVSPYDTDAPTYSPSATRDNAAELTVRSGEETTADIRYRGEPGHTVSGRVRLDGAQPASVYLISRGTGGVPVINSFQVPEAPGFAITGVPDGEYTITAHLVMPTTLGAFKSAVAAPLRISVKGADVTGIELVPKPLGSIAGRVSLVGSTLPECKGKRRPLLNEIIVDTRKDSPKEDSNDLPFVRFFSTVATPNSEGDFDLQNLRGGKYVLEPRFFARYWYLQSVMLPSQTTVAKTTSVKTKPEASRNWVSLRDGERVSGLTIILAEGAASVRGKLNIAEGTRVPDKMAVYLVPAEREKADDVFRYFTSKVDPDASFAFSNLPPGKYWTIGQEVDTEELSAAKFRFPSSAEARSKIRSAAEKLAKEISLKPCQNVNDFQIAPK